MPKRKTKRKPQEGKPRSTQVRRIRLPDATWQRFSRFADAAGLSQADAMAALLRRGEAWASLWAFMTRGAISNWPGIERDALRLMRQEMGLRLELNALLRRLVEELPGPEDEKARLLDQIPSDDEAAVVEERLDRAVVAKKATVDAPRWEGDLAESEEE